jgi:DNA primase
VGLWKKALAEALPLVDFLFEAHTANLRLDTPQGKADAAKRLLPVLLEVRDRVKQDAYLRRLAGMLRIDERALRQEMDFLRREQARDTRNGHFVPETGQKSYMKAGGGEQAETVAEQQAQGGTIFRLVPTPKSQEALSIALEETCLGLLLVSPILTEDICGIIDEVDFTGTETRALYHIFVTALHNGTLTDIQRMLSALPDIVQETAERLRQEVEMRERMESISRIRRRPGQKAQPMAESSPVLDISRLRKVATKAAYRLKRARLKEAHNELIYLRQEAGQAGDHEGLAALDQRVKELLLQIETIDSAVPLHS